MILDISSLSIDTSNALKRRIRKFLHERASQIQKDLESYWQNDYSDTKQKLIAEQIQIEDFLKKMDQL